ncbi:MAG: hypothetical protein IIZ47_04215 [Erysipelotrichaceae bacterium]|nr:hypothetical protein [Erysipelotrichaceae bacterium]
MRNRIFSYLLILFLLAGIGIFALPQREVSAMEKRPLAHNADITMETVRDGSLSVTLENILKDQFYARDTLTSLYYRIKTLLNKPFASAGVDTEGLQDVEFTFLSDNVIEINDGYLINNILLYDDQKAYLATSRGYNVNEAATAYPDIRTYVYFPTRLEEILDVGNDLNYGLNYRNSYLHQLSDAIRTDRLKIETVSDYQTYFQKSDFHWNARGAYQGYCDIINMISRDFDLDPVRPVKEEISYPYEFHGNISSQVGQLGETDHITDLLLEGIGDYDYTVNGQPVDLHTVKEDYAAHGNTTQYSDFDYYFGDNAFERIFDFHQEDKPNILIFADSFTNVTQEWIASHFNKTVIIDLRAKDESFSLQRYVEDYDIDIFLVTMYYQNLYFNGNMYIPIN